MSESLVMFLYLVSAVCSIMSIRGLSSPKSAIGGVKIGMIGMALAILPTLFMPEIHSYTYIILGILVGGSIGTFIAKTAPMTALPELVALFNSFVGLAAVFIGIAVFYNPAAYGEASFELGMDLAIGAVTFTGSVIAFGKLHGLVPSKPLVYKGQNKVNALLGASILLAIITFTLTGSSVLFWFVVAASLAIGIMTVIPIGGADMPVVISILNAYSGLSSVAAGFTLQNSLLIIIGSLVGASGIILSYVMCKAMNRSFANVILGGFGGETEASTSGMKQEDKVAKIGSPEDAAFMMKNASSVIIVPGYGMAVAQAQHALKEMVDILKKEGVQVRYAIHPVAGRMPGHMNVLLAEANVPYEDVLELEEINRDFAQTDVAFVIGANDITNPAAKNDKSSPIYGMPVLDVENAKTVLFVKRSMGSGYAGIDNELFYYDNTMMLLGDAKKMCESVIKACAE